MNSKVNKPWGSFEILDNGKNYLVKKISVNPGGILSLQRHKYRSEHWIVAEGQAEVTVDDKISILDKNENIFIPQGSIHRLSNKTSNNLIIIEMWYGEKLDENDIERYEDIYNRK
ncbi:phosphomannose isomerase type II C-terminal cupin domain [Pelagibacteraceae bacterium]|nr:phosphomannose isomerase type II C-terminal cupin domain [Pelagibacteraceae bacterium]